MVSMTSTNHNYYHWRCYKYIFDERIASSRLSSSLNDDEEDNNLDVDVIDVDIDVVVIIV